MSIEKIDFEKTSYFDIARQIATHYNVEKTAEGYVFKHRSGEGKPISQAEMEKLLAEKITNYRQLPEKEPDVKKQRVLAIVKFILELLINLVGFISSGNDNRKAK